MRTTLTLDPDVAHLIEKAMHRERRPMKQVVNDALRRGLRPGRSSSGEPYQLTPHKSALRPGLDPTGFNRLADEMEAECLPQRHRAHPPSGRG